jgi:hypothetical protein
MNRAIKMPACRLPISRAPIASAQKDQDTVAIKIALGFAHLAGSHDNALALVHALREGVEVRLVPSIALASVAKAGITEIAPPTGTMTWHDVKMALMLARDALQRYGILHPACEQVRAALTGGEVTAPDGRVVTLQGVLNMRAEGMNWGRIAAERFRRPEVTSRGHLQATSLERVAKFLRP